MDTAPKNQAALTHHAPTSPPRQSVAAERLWVLHKGTSRLRAELRDQATAGAELHLFQDDAFIYSQRYLTRGIALEEAEGCRQLHVAEGWQE